LRQAALTHQTNWPWDKLLLVGRVAATMVSVPLMVMTSPATPVAATRKRENRTQKKNCDGQPDCRFHKTSLSIRPWTTRFEMAVNM